MTNGHVINLNPVQYLELEKIGLGAFDPLGGFMDEAQFRSVVNTLRLPGGGVFTVPVVLDVNESLAKTLQDATEVDLMYSGKTVGTLKPNDFFQCDRNDAAEKIYGTNDAKHPGVKYFFDLQPIFIGGKVELKERIVSDISLCELTPEQTRVIFRERNWKHIAGFQTRNVPHRAHEYLQRVALEHVDGLFLQPLLGRKRKGDFTPQAIMRGYETLVEHFLPKCRVLLGALSTFMRYAGPREAVFHAIVRRNYGCTHFIVGRDHAGVGDWYGTYDAHELTRQFDGDLGIEVMRLHGPYFCETCDGIVTDKTCPHTGGIETRSISGTDMRRILVNGKMPDPTLMRPEIVDALRGSKLFITQES